MIDLTFRYLRRRNDELNDSHLGGSFIPNICAFCGDTDGMFMFHVDGYAIARCPRCNMVYTGARTATADSLYDEAYYSRKETKRGCISYFSEVEANNLTFARRLQTIEQRFGRRGRLLDVGCAMGDFLVIARAAGWDTCGVEVSPWASEIARQQHGLSVHTGSLESASFPDESFDVVTLYDVIEHATDPLALLREIRRVLVPRGLLHIVTPNVGGFLAAILGRHWYHYKPGEHLYYFSPSTIVRAAKEAGLEPVSCARTGSVLTPLYILDRLRYLNTSLAVALSVVLRFLRLADFRLYLCVGELQAWARRSDR